MEENGKIVYTPTPITADHEETTVFIMPDAGSTKALEGEQAVIQIVYTPTPITADHEETTVFIMPDADSTKALEGEQAVISANWEKEEEEREQWTSGLDFILTLIGYAVGVSNLWRFPYLTLRNGGGAFLIPFFFFLLLCGIPLFYMEVCLGQFSGISSLFVWKLCPLFKGIGYGMVLVSAMACIFYNAVLSWVIYYLVNSFSSDLPWASCGHWWNTPNCVAHQSDMRASLLPTSGPNRSDGSSAFSTEFVNSSANSTNGQSCFGNATVCGSKYMTAAEEFWLYNVLRKSDGLHDLGSMQLHIALTLLAAWILVCLCLIRGIKSLGKVVYFTALMPYVLLSIFLVRGCMLPGAIDGIIFYVKPDFAKLKNLNVWVEACLQVFFSLGPAWGGLITMASFNKFHNKCFRDAVIATLADGLTSVYGGFVIFSVVGFMAKEANVTVVEVATQGPGLTLVAYPEAISKLPVPQLWAVLFFFMLLLLGIDSQFGMFETVVTGLIDAFPQQLRKKRIRLTFGIALVCYCLSLPIATNGGIYVFTLLDWFVAAFCVVIYSFVECFVICWIYGIDRFSEDIEMMLGKKPHLFVKMCWTVFTPLIMFIAFIFICVTYTLPVYDGYVFPMWANVVGFFISVIPLIPLPIGAVMVLWSCQGTFMQRLKYSLRPAEDWGPSAKEYKELYEEKAKEYSRRPHWLVALCRCRKL